ncbi:MAG: FecR family protein [Cyclobacteriaceae bacterium]
MDHNRIYRFFHGQASHAEARQVLAWLNAKKSEPEVIDLIKSYWQHADEIDWNADESWNKFLIKMQEQKLNDGTKTSKREELKLYQSQLEAQRNQNLWLKIAASIVFIISIGFVLNKFIQTGEPDSISVVNYKIEKSTEKGQKLTVFLKDGTKVILNSESSLVYPQFFEDSLRVVYLKGEAFFDVAKNAKVPFKVISEAAETTVLGTQFNINSQQDNQSIISLVSGSVLVELSNYQSQHVQRIKLSPGQAATANLNVDKLQVTNFDYEETILWKDGILYFQQASFDQLISKLENWYGVVIEVNGKENIDKKHFSGKFDNESLKNVLESVSFSKNFSYQITEKKVIINFK